MIKSPCVHYCILKKDVCPACGRSIDEISDWLVMTDEERLKTIESAKRRIEGLKAKGEHVDYS